MKRRVIFDGYVGRWDTPSFFVVDNDRLDISLDVHESIVGDHYVAIACKDGVVCERYQGQEIAITRDMLKDDVLEISLQLRTKEGDRVIIPSAKTPQEKGYYVEPLKLIYMDGVVSATGWLTELEERMSRIERTQSNINARLDEFASDGVPLDFEE